MPRWWTTCNPVVAIWWTFKLTSNEDSKPEESPTRKQQQLILCWRRKAAPESYKMCFSCFKLFTHCHSDSWNRKDPKDDHYQPPWYPKILGACILKTTSESIQLYNNHDRWLMDRMRSASTVNIHHSYISENKGWYQQKYPRKTSIHDTPSDSTKSLNSPVASPIYFLE